MPHGEHDLEQAFGEAFSDEQGNLLIPHEYRKPLITGLVKAVEFATVRAAENLRGLQVRKDIRNIALIVAVIVAAICVPVTYILTREAEVHTCRLVTKIANVQRERAVENKIGTEKFKRESADRLGLSPKKFDALIAEGEAREARQLAVYEEVAKTTC